VSLEPIAANGEELGVAHVRNIGLTTAHYPLFEFRVVPLKVIAQSPEAIGLAGSMRYDQDPCGSVKLGRDGLQILLTEFILVMTPMALAISNILVSLFSIMNGRLNTQRFG
jgi:hypothetical protein